jgi:hypothetical protein
MSEHHEMHLGLNSDGSVKIDDSFMPGRGNTIHTTGQLSTTSNPIHYRAGNGAHNSLYQRQRWVQCTFMKRGIHAYPEAGTNPLLATGDKYDVSYLAQPHAHDFWFSVKVEVFENDREIEFIQLRLRLEDLYEAGVLQCGRKSCETMAEELIEHILSMYPGKPRRISVGVFEDSLLANGGIVEHIPQPVRNILT